MLGVRRAIEDKERRVKNALTKRGSQSCMDQEKGLRVRIRGLWG
jgi:hypothetical protein